MGCGESKQAVATQNTLTKSKSKATKQENTNNLPVEKPTNDDANVNNSNAGENVEENEKVPLIGKENDNSTRKEDEKEKQAVDLDHGDKESEARKKTDEDEAIVAVDENVGGDGKNEEELKGGESVFVVSNVSPKKDDNEETIESIISEGVSGKSDYYSPRSKGHVYEGNDDEEKDTEDKSSKEKEELEEVKVSSAPTDEQKSSGKEKVSAAEKETANAASTAEVKAS